MTAALIVQANALHIPMLDESVDLIVTSPPYFALRSYRDGDEHYADQIGSEATPTDFIEALWAVTAEMVRVLKPSGSIFVNLGDKYSGSGGHNNNGIGSSTLGHHKGGGGPHSAKLSVATRRNAPDRYNQNSGGIPTKSLMGLPWRYAIGCIDRLGLILRAEIVWSKPNGLPESVTDRVRRSHETWFHFTRQGRYFASVDEVREAHNDRAGGPERFGNITKSGSSRTDGVSREQTFMPSVRDYNPLGKLPGSVWTVPSEPLIVSDEVKRHYNLPDHFACLDADTDVLTRRGWLRHNEVTTDDEIAGFDLDTGAARWTKCLGVHTYDYNGPMVAVEKRDLSMRLTPNHRAIVRRPHSVTPLTDAVVDARDLGPKHAIPRSAPWADLDEPKGIGESMAALCGWIAAEGWYDAGKTVRISQSLTANPEKCADLERLWWKLMPGQGVMTRYRERVWRGKPWTDCVWNLPPVLAAEVRRLMPAKRLTCELANLPENERRALLDAFIDGDGHRRPDGRIGIFQKERENLDWLQMIAVTLGYKTTLRTDGTRWVLYLTTGGRAISLRGTNGTNLPISREHYTGTVWCPTTGTGTFFARRNGSVFITGNSFPQELPRRIILGWSPSSICTACGEGRRPVVVKQGTGYTQTGNNPDTLRALVKGADTSILADPRRNVAAHRAVIRDVKATITGYACACPDTSAQTRSSVVLDVFGGTGTTAGVARALGRIGVSVDLSHDYCRLADWRIHKSTHFSKTSQRTHKENQTDLFGASA